jgi:hypothetical protein
MSDNDGPRANLTLKSVVGRKPLGMRVKRDTLGVATDNEAARGGMGQLMSHMSYMLDLPCSPSWQLVDSSPHALLPPARNALFSSKHY